MDLALFPLDTQTCHLTIASYGWAANDLDYMWKVETRILFIISLLRGYYVLIVNSIILCMQERAYAYPVLKMLCLV